MINDISTDLLNPPAFEFVLKENPGKDYTYPKDFADIQREKYPDLEGLKMNVSTSPAECFRHILKTARGMKNWKLAGEDSENLKVEYVATTSIMRYKDDVVLEVRHTDEVTPRCVIHMRSKSRVGKSDLGKNAARIRDFFKRLKN